MSVGKQFFYLNLENRWPLFVLHGLEIDKDGSLTLARVPEVESSEEITLQRPEEFEVPAGIATDKEGNIYLSDPVEDRIFKYDMWPTVATIAFCSSTCTPSRSRRFGPRLNLPTSLGPMTNRVRVA
jgi:hypothetical protein